MHPAIFLGFLYMTFLDIHFCFVKRAEKLDFLHSLTDKNIYIITCGSQGACRKGRGMMRYT